MNAVELQKFLNEVIAEMEAAGEISIQEPVEILVKPKSGRDKLIGDGHA